MIITPHYFQTDAKNAIFDYYEKGGKGNPLVCMPTGSGKSIVIADFLRDVFRFYPNQRVLMLTHVWKLILQNAQKMQTFWPTAPIGIHSAGLGQRDTMMPIIFGGVQSVAKNPEAFGHRDLILIDESHLLGSDEDSQYLKVIAALTKINPYLKVIGFTATPYRLKMGKLTDGGLFSDICFDITTHEWFKRLIAEGYLSPLVGKPTKTVINGVSQLSIIGGDFNNKQAEALVDTDEITYNACKELLEIGYDRQKCMIFAAGVKNAEHIANMLDSFGASVTFVHSKLDSETNRKRLEAFDNDEYWCIVGANMLTTGYDNPRIDLIGDFQPTCSPGKHVQKYGRGTRVSPGKNNCRVLDFVGNIGRNGPIDDPVLPRKPGEKTGEPPPIKICSAEKLLVNKGKDPKEWVLGCDEYNHASVRFCCGCAEEFSFETKLSATAFNNAPMKEDENPVFETVPIKRPVIYQRHEGKQKAAGIISPPTVKAIYPFGIRTINMFLCFEHTGRPGHNAREWWKRHAATEPPKTVNEFLSRTNELRQPKAMLVHANLRYPEVINWEF